MPAKRTSTKGSTPANRQPAKRTSVATAAAAPLTAEGAADSATLVTQGYIRVTIGDDHFELRGTVGDHLKVAWHKPFEEAVDLGTIPEMVGAVAGAIGVADAAHFTDELNKKLDALESIGGLKPVAHLLKTATVKVTDLAIDTQIGKYEFGFGVDLSASDVSYKGVSLDAFGLLFTYTAPPPQPPE
jgi:hypothetical protein